MNTSTNELSEKMLETKSTMARRKTELGAHIYISSDVVNGSQFPFKVGDTVIVKVDKSSQEADCGEDF